MHTSIHLILLMYLSSLFMININNNRCTLCTVVPCSTQSLLPSCMHPVQKRSDVKSFVSLVPNETLVFDPFNVLVKCRFHAVALCLDRFFGSLLGAHQSSASIDV